MQANNCPEKKWHRAFAQSLPVAMGYYPAGIAFGVLAAAAGLPAWLCVSLSIIVYSGAAQYAAIPLFAAGAGIFTLTLNTVIINLRHVFYAIPLLHALPDKPWQKIYTFFALTDESFSVMTTLPENERKPLFIRILFLNQFYWVSASVIGFMLGEGLNRLIPHLDFALVCLFVILWYEQFCVKRIIWSSIAAVLAFCFAKTVTADYALMLSVGLCAFLIMLEPALPEAWRIRHARLFWLMIALIAAILVGGMLLTEANGPTARTAMLDGVTPQAVPLQVLAVLCMGVSTFLLRFAPALIPKRYLQSPALLALNLALPLSVMIILVLANIDIPGALSGSLKLIFAQVTALFAVCLVYRQWHNVLIGMMIGVAVLNGILSW